MQGEGQDPEPSAAPGHHGAPPCTWHCHSCPPRPGSTRCPPGPPWGVEVEAHVTAHTRRELATTFPHNAEPRPANHSPDKSTIGPVLRCAVAWGRATWWRAVGEARPPPALLSAALASPGAPLKFTHLIRASSACSSPGRAGGLCVQHCLPPGPEEMPWGEAGVGRAPAPQSHAGTQGTVPARQAPLPLSLTLSPGSLGQADSRSLPPPARGSLGTQACCVPHRQVTPWANVYRAPTTHQCWGPGRARDPQSCSPVERHSRAGDQR